MKTIYIDATELKAVRVLAAKADIRFYLNGVLVQATARETRIVATDGHVAGIFDRYQQNEGVTFDEFIIPTDVIDALKPDAKFPVRVTIDGDQYRIQQYDDRVSTFRPIDGRYPDYSRIVPSEANGECAQFDGAVLARIDKAQKLIDKKNSAYIWHNGLDGAPFELQGPGRFIGVVMPLRFNKTERTLPLPDVSTFRRGLTVEQAAPTEATAPETEDDLL